MKTFKLTAAVLTATAIIVAPFVAPAAVAPLGFVAVLVFAWLVK